LTTKIHQPSTGGAARWRMVVTGGQRNDGAMLTEVLAEIRVARLVSCRPRTRPDAVIADRAYATGVIRSELRRRGIKAVVPDKRDQAAARKRRGSRGGRPPGLDTGAYRGRNVIERVLRAGEAMARYRDQVRQAGHHLPRRGHTLRHPHLEPTDVIHALGSVDSMYACR
jgi:hypothetical protein